MLLLIEPIGVILLQSLSILFINVIEVDDVSCELLPLLLLLLLFNDDRLNTEPQSIDVTVAVLLLADVNGNVLSSH